MARITTTIVIFMILANGAVSVMASTGLSEDLGVDLAPGINDRMDKTVDHFKTGFSPNVSVTESFINLALALGSLFNVLFASIFALPAMLGNLGFPDQIVTMAVSPLYVISGLEMALVIVGR